MIFNRRARDRTELIVRFSWCPISPELAPASANFRRLSSSACVHGREACRAGSFIFPSPSARARPTGVYSRCSVAWLLLTRSVSISGRSKLSPFSSRAAPEVARPPWASIVDQLGAGLSFCFRPEPELDQAADGFGARSNIVLITPSVDRGQLSIMHPHKLRSPAARRFWAADLLFDISN
jgi:hypothetical protein